MATYSELVFHYTCMPDYLDYHVSLVSCVSTYLVCYAYLESYGYMQSCVLGK